MTIRNLLEKRLLPSLSRRFGCLRYDITRGIRLRNILNKTAGERFALLATHDLSLSGAPRIVLEMAAILRQRNYVVILVTMADGPMRREFEALGVFILVDRCPHVNKRYLIDLAELADFAIANSVVTANIALTWSHSVKTFWYLHEVSLLEARLIDRSVVDTLKSVTRVWAGSDLCARLIREIRSDVFIFPYGIVPVDPPTDPVIDHHFRIGVFGSIESRKGQDYVIEAVGLLDRSIQDQIKVDIYGRTLDLGYAQSLKRAASDYSMITFHGEMDRVDYLRSIRQCDAVLVSSRDDTLPLVSLDALSSGRVLLLTPSVGTANWLTDGVDVLIANETTGAGVSGLIERAVAERGNKDNIGRAGQRAFNRNFSQTAFTKRMVRELGIDDVTAQKDKCE